MSAADRSITLSHRNAVRICAVRGAAAWLAYAVVECWALSILPWIAPVNLSDRSVHWDFTLLLFAVYPACGFLLAGLTGLALVAVAPGMVAAGRPPGAEVFRTVGSLSLPVAYLVNAVIRLGMTPPVVMPGVNAALLVTVLVLVMVDGRRWRAWRGFANPWVTATLTLGVPWVTTDLLVAASRPLRARVAASVVIAAYGLIAGIQAFRDRRQGDQPLAGAPQRVAGPLVIGTLVCAVSLGLSAAARPAPYREKGTPSQTQTATGRPPVVLISLDTTRADHLSVYGYYRDTTPTLRALTAEATLYTRAVSAADMTMPSHASMFTGRYASEHGAHESMPPALFGSSLGPDLPTLAGILSGAGYRTIGVVANSGNLGRWSGLSRGFQYYDARGPVRFLGQEQAHYFRGAAQLVFKVLAGSPEADMPYRQANELNRDVWPLLGSLEHDVPSFLFINYMDAHYPYRPPPPFDSKFHVASEVPVRGYSPMATETMSGQRPISDDERRYYESQYDGGITFADAHLGELFARLRALDLYDGSLIVVTADHGEAFGDRALIGHGVSVYADQVNVPLIIKYPRQRHAAVVDAAVSTIDILPTILDVVGLDIIAGIEGRSLNGDGAPQPPRLLMSESFAPWFLYGTSERFHRTERAIFDGEFKLVTSTSGKRELYDLTHDPNEQHDLSSSQSARAEALAEDLNHLLATVARSAGPAPALDPDTLERLRSLGYVR